MREPRLGYEERCRNAYRELDEVLGVGFIEDRDGILQLASVVKELGKKLPLARNQDHVVALLDAQVAALVDYDKHGCLMRYGRYEKPTEN